MVIDSQSAIHHNLITNDRKPTWQQCMLQWRYMNTVTQTIYAQGHASFSCSVHSGSEQWVWSDILQNESNQKQSVHESFQIMLVHMVFWLRDAISAYKAHKRPCGIKPNSNQIKFSDSFHWYYRSISGWHFCNVEIFSHLICNWLSLYFTVVEMLYLLSYWRMKERRGYCLYIGDASEMVGFV